MEILAAVEDCGSISAAAEILGLSQPNASRALRRLERSLRLPLIVRHPSGAGLTSHGRLLASWARPVVAAKDELESALASLADTPRSLHIAASQTIAEYVLPTWLSAFRGQAEVSLEVANSSAVIHLVRSGAAHLGFVESAGSIRDLHTLLVGRDRLLVVARPGHPWADREISLADLAETGLIMREEGSGTREAWEMAMAAAGYTPAPPALELASNAAVRTAALSTDHPAVLSEHAVREALATGTLVKIPGLSFPRILRAVWPSGPLEAEAQALAELAGRLA